MNIMREVEAKKEELEKAIELEKLKQEGPIDQSSRENSKLDGWSSKLIPKFSESEVNKFFIAFEKVATQLEWKKELWPVIVQSVFVGKAQIAYSGLSNEDSKDYEKVKSVVLAAYQLVPEAYRQKFRSCTKKLSQTFLELAKEKEILFNEWSHAAKVDNFDALKELILVADFKNSIYHEICTHVEEFNITNLEAAAQASDRYVLTHKLTKVGSFNKSSGSSKQTVQDASIKAQTNPSSPKKSYKPMSQRVCYGCGKLGHMKAQCTSKKASGVTLIGPEVMIASKAGQHKVLEGLSKGFGDFVSLGKVSEVPGSTAQCNVVILRDTGAIQSCILRSSLPPDFVLQSDKYVLLGVFSGR